MRPKKVPTRPLPAGPRPTGPKLQPGPVVAVAVAGLLVGGCSGSSSSSPSSTAASAAASGSVAASPSVTSQLQDDYQRVIVNVLPSVVQITAGNSLGSGIVFDGQGDIVTNAHVIGSASSFTVTLANSTAPLNATLVGSYPDSDLAVIKLSSPPSGLRPAVFGDSSKVRVGQITLAMGSPLGLAGSVTQGIVSATGRTVTEPKSADSPGATIGNMVQTSAAINPGNSGGALVNLSSQVIGINTLAAIDQELNGSAAPGIGFAIPAATVTSIASQLIKDGKVTNSGRAALGVAVRPYFNSDFQPAGVVIVSVTDGGPAATAGLQPGDVITKVGDTEVTDVASLSTALASLSPGNTVTVTYVRDGQTKTANVTLGTL
ncbi:S1C family serine protease [Kitasatospora cinereorecta]|uniref:S1C family serine protease n=1 Tax=Kitasatospora cinereorecta TaxID=285560 RepID=A0ABW0VPK5_9ACTN